MSKKYVVGLDLGGTKIYTALVDLNGTIIKEKVVETLAFEGEEAVINRMMDTIDYVIEGTDKELIKAIGIGAPGALDLKEGIVIESPNLPFENFELVGKIRARYDLQTYLDNVATLGEYKFGAGKGTENMIYMTVSTGIGGGAILNGKIFRGSTGNALEIGHTTISQERTRCGCGKNGCAESLASGTAIGKRAKEAVNSNAETALKNYDDVTSKEVFIEAANGDRVAKEILNTSLTYLGITVANIITTFDPEKVVIGGGVINGGDIVLETVKEEVAKRCMKVFVDSCSIEKAKLGGQAGVLGAAALAIME